MAKRFLPLIFLLVTACASPVEVCTQPYAQLAAKAKADGYSVQIAPDPEPLLEILNSIPPPTEYTADFVSVISNGHGATVFVLVVQHGCIVSGAELPAHVVLPNLRTGFES